MFRDWLIKKLRGATIKAFKREGGTSSAPDRSPSAGKATSIAASSVVSKNAGTAKANPKEAMGVDGEQHPAETVAPAIPKVQEPRPAATPDMTEAQDLEEEDRAARPTHDTKAQANMVGLQPAVIAADAARTTDTGQPPVAATATAPALAVKALDRVTMPPEGPLRAQPAAVSGASSASNAPVSTAETTGPGPAMPSPANVEPAHASAAPPVKDSAEQAFKPPKPAVPVTTEAATDRTPLWTQALATWKESEPKDYAAYEALLTDTSRIPQSADFLSKLRPEQKQSSKWLLRLKRCEPMFNAVRGIAVALASLDPHKVAPYVVHSVFGFVNIVCNRMNPELEDRVLDILFGCSDAIQELISFELYFPSQGNPVIQNKMDVARQKVLSVYPSALQLMFQVQSSCKDIQKEHDSKKDKVKDWFAIRGRAAWNQMVDKEGLWGSQEKALKRQLGEFTRLKKDMEEAIKEQDKFVAILKWFRADNDPGPGIKAIRRRVMLDPTYEQQGQWLLEHPEFLSWCQTFMPSDEQAIEKIVFWLKGSVGTGKTTLVYLASQALTGRTVYQPPDQNLRVLYYFCSPEGTKRSTLEAVIRSIISQLALLPDFTIDENAKKKYDTGQSVQGSQEGLVLEDWLDMCVKLVQGRSAQDHFVILIDALDESDDADALLLYLSENLMTSCSNVSLLCSSRQHISVQDYFGLHKEHFLAETEFSGRDAVRTVNIVPALTKKELVRFVDVELARRKRYQKTSVFYRQDLPEQPELYTRLRTSLLECSQGMFMWVRAWLDILVPGIAVSTTAPKDPSAPPRQRVVWQVPDAQKRLDEMEGEGADVLIDNEKHLQLAYQRLWNANGLGDEGGLRNRLFHLVLGAFEPLSPAEITRALRIDGPRFNGALLSEQVIMLHANFLYEDPTTEGLRFVHGSARSFVIDLALDGKSAAKDSDERAFSDRRNHVAIASLYMDILQLSTHPFWAGSGFNPSKWLHLLDWHPPDELVGISRVAAVASIQERRRKQRRAWNGDLGSHEIGTRSAPFHAYIVRYGLRHCASAAVHQSILDPVWRDFVDKILIRRASALPFALAMEQDQLQFRFQISESLRVFLGLSDHFDSRFVFGGAYRSGLLPAHLLVILGLLRAYDDNDGDAHVEDEVILQARFGRSNVKELLNDFHKLGNPEPGLLYYDNGEEAAADKPLTALGIAVRMQDERAIRLFSKVTTPLPEAEVRDLLTTRDPQPCAPDCTADAHEMPECQAPICMALEYDMPTDRRFAMIKSLLDLEKACRGLGSSRVLEFIGWQFRSLQWSQGVLELGQPALNFAICIFEEAQVCELLDLAAPENINTQGSDGATALHYAVSLGKLNLTRKLVEKYGADCEIEDSSGQKPAHAVSHASNDMMNYWSSRGVGVKTEVANRTLSPPKCYNRSRRKAMTQEYDRLIQLERRRELIERLGANDE